MVKFTSNLKKRIFVFERNDIKMITKENRTEKICSFYASDYHLEMIMIPYINKKIEKGANINIVTEKNLTETVKTVISKVNLPKERKKEILDINWENRSIDNIDVKNKSQEIIIFVIGNVNYINKMGIQIEKSVKQNSLTIIDCYNIEEVQKSITEIVVNHSKVLNTTDEKRLH